MSKKEYSEESKKSDREWIKHQMEATKQASEFGVGGALIVGGLALVILIAWFLNH